MCEILRAFGMAVRAGPLQHSRLIQVPMRRSLRDRACGLKPLYPRERLHRFANLQQQLSDMNGTRLRAMNRLDSGVVFVADGFG